MDGVLSPRHHDGVASEVIHQHGCPVSPTPSPRLLTILAVRTTRSLLTRLLR